MKRLSCSHKSILGQGNQFALVFVMIEVERPPLTMIGIPEVLGILCHCPGEAGNHMGKPY